MTSHSQRETGFGLGGPVDPDRIRRAVFGHDDLSAQRLLPVPAFAGVQAELPAACSPHDVGGAADHPRGRNGRQRGRARLRPPAWTTVTGPPAR